jgi:hypothetical protein
MKTLGQIACEAHQGWGYKDGAWDPDLEVEWAPVAQAVRLQVIEECAKVCDEGARRNYPWASENSDTYHTQADWAEVLAKRVRLLKEKKET